MYLLWFRSVPSRYDHWFYGNIDGHVIRNYRFIAVRHSYDPFATCHHESDRSVKIIYPSFDWVIDRWYNCNEEHYVCCMLMTIVCIQNCIIFIFINFLFIMNCSLIFVVIQKYQSRKLDTFNYIVVFYIPT